MREILLNLINLIRKYQIFLKQPNFSEILFFVAKAVKIEPRTYSFIKEYERLQKEGRMPKHVDLAKVMQIKSPSSISEMLGKRQNIQPDAWEAFKKFFGISDSEISEYSVSTEHGNPKPVDYQLKYIDLLEKDLNAYRDALSKLNSHDKRIETLETIAGGLQERVAELEAIVPAYQEWLLEEFALLNPKRGAEIIEDALGKRLVAHGIKVSQKGTPKHSGK